MASFNKKATIGVVADPILASKSDPLHILQMVKNLKPQPVTGVTDDEILLRARNLAQLESFCGFLPIWKGSKSPMLKYGGEPHLSLQEALGFKPAALAVRSPNLLTLDLEQTYWRTFLQSCKLFPNVRELLTELNKYKIKTAIITDLTSQIQFRKIIFFGLEQYFDYVVTSEESGFDKTIKYPFELALKKLNLNPEECWMIGDNLYADILGGQKSGLITLHKFNAKSETNYKEIIPDASFNEFEEIINLANKVLINS